MYGRFVEPVVTAQRDGSAYFCFRESLIAWLTCSVRQSMRRLYEEIVQRFPEVNRWIVEGDDESPYLMMSLVARWIKDTASREEDLLVATARLKAFVQWCEEEPRGDTAGDDVLTIVVVSLYEKLFDQESTRKLVPNIMTKVDFVRNAEYLKTWVGAENYDATSKYFT